MKKKLLALILALVMVLSLASMAGAATHIVEKGDNLSKLAEEYLGSRLKWREIYEANKDKISDPNAIYVGQELVIPETETPAEPVEELVVESIVANCESEPYGKAIKSFTFYVNSVESVMDLTADDFLCTHLVYDGMEVHAPFDAKALSVYFTKNSVIVEVEPFYPDMSFTREGYWAMTCTNPAFSIDAATELTYIDPVVDAFEQFTKTYGEGEGAATLDCYLYTPENAEGRALPLVVFNSGGSGISVTGDPYGANFGVSFAKDHVQAENPCYVLYPQRNTGSTDNLCAAIKEIIDGLITEGKVDADRIYMTGESAGSMFTMNFVSRYPGYNAAIAIFNGGYGYQGATLEETLKEDAESPFSDAEMKQLAESGTKVMLVQSLGDTTSFPLKYATTYKKLIACGMEPGVDVIWHYYTAEKFNALLGDNTHWIATADAGYVTDPITGVTTYYYPEGKLHNSSYPAANDEHIKLWLFDQHKGEYSVEFSKDQYSAQYTSTHTDYSIIPEKYTKVATLEDVPCVPAGNKTTVTVYTDETETFYYIAFNTFFSPDTQYVEALVVGGAGRVVMDCSGTWWTNDIIHSTMPHILALDHIDWQPYVRDAE